MSRFSTLVVVLACVLALTGCVPGGGPSDLPRTAHTSGAEIHTTLNLYAYAVPKVAYDELVPAFAATDAGHGVHIHQSYGASGDQSRKVASGAQADIVNFSVTPDITRLVDAGLVDPDWDTGPHQGSPFGSVVTFVVREGNPDNIHNWDDLLRPGIEVVTPNPFSSGAAKWNLLAPYAAASGGGQDPDAGLAYLTALINDHVRLQPASGREATEAFLQGSGDVLLSYENEALFLERQGDPVQHVIPPATFRIDNPAAVLNNSPHPQPAEDFLAYLGSPPGQEILARNGFRPADATIAAQYAADFPTPDILYAIDDLGGWTAVDRDLFQAGHGSIALIYEGAAR